MGVKSGVIGGGNSRKPVFGFRLSKEGLFCKGLGWICFLISIRIRKQFFEGIKNSK